MTYEARENSTQDGRPIELYIFTLGATEWCYTSADENLTVDGKVFRAVPIKNPGFNVTGEAASDALSIEAPSSIGPAQLFMMVPPSQTIWIVIWRKHEGEDEFLVSYQGEVSQINFPMPGKCIVTCETLSASLHREGLRIGWSRTCPYAVYDPDTCKKDKATMAVPIIVLGVIGNDVISDEVGSYAEDFFTGGMIEWDDPYRGHEIRLIEKHVNNTLTMFNSAQGAYVGMIAVVYRGCKQTVASCIELENYDNYGGVPDMPGKSPFDGDPVF